MDAAEDAIDEVHTLQEELQKKAAEIAQLREKLQKQTEQVIRLQTDMKVMMQQADEKRQLDVSRLQGWVESQSEEIRELQANLRDKDMALKRLGDLQSERDDLSRRLQEISAAEVSAGQHAQILKAEFEKEVQRLEEQRDRLERENKALKESSPQSRGIVKQPRQRGLSDALNENLELQDRVGNLEVENKDLRKQRDELREALGSRKDSFTRRSAAAVEQGSALTRAKNVARMVVSRVNEQRLHRRLDEEGERAQEFEMRARDLEDQGTRLHRENIRLREELEFAQSHANQQRMMKYGAKQKAEDRDVKMEELQRQIQDMKVKLEETAHDEMMIFANMKGNEAAMLSLYTDLKAPDFDFDGIQSDSDIELESEPCSFQVPRCEESGRVSVSDEMGSSGSVAHREKSGPVSASDERDEFTLGSEKSASEVKSFSSHAVNSAPYKRYFAMYQPREKVGAALANSSYVPPGGYRTKRERQIAQMAGSVVQQKLLKALHLIELLQRANSRLTEDMEDLEDAAAMAQRMERWLLIVVTFMSLLVVGLGLGLMSSCKG